MSIKSGPTFEYFPLEVELPGRKVEVECKVRAEWENDGIGPYEYHGQKCFDKGNNFLTITSVSFDTGKFNEEEREIIRAAIDEKQDEWETEMNSLPIYD